LAGEKIFKPELDLIGKPFSVAYHANFWELLTSLCVCVCVCVFVFLFLLIISLLLNLWSR
jgi:hypothetical protein